jgi:hypothetical protein
LSYGIKTFWCTHGCCQEPRGGGERVHNATRYTGCEARITAEVKRVGNTGKWIVLVHQEVMSDMLSM